MYATEPLGSTGSVALGREPDSDVHIDDPSISRNHALIHLDPPLRIEDLGSSNGTWVREERIAPNQPCEIQLNEPVRVGHVTIVVHRRPNRLRLFRLQDHDYFESRVADECARSVRSQGHFAIAHAVLDRPLREVRDVLAATCPGLRRRASRLARAPRRPNSTWDASPSPTRDEGTGRRATDT